MKDRLIALLRWSERYTKTDMVYLASGGFWLGVSQIGIGLIAFGVSVAFAHFVSKETYGTYRFLLAAFWTISAFSLSGITSAMARAVAQGAEGTYKRSFKPFIIGCLPMAVIGLVASLYYYAQGNIILAGGMLAIAILGPFLQPSYLFGSFLEGKRAFKMNAMLGIILNAVPAFALLAGMFLSDDPLVFLSIYLGANLLSGFALSIYVYRHYHPNDVSDPALLNLSYHLSANNVLAVLAQQADELLVYHFLGAASVAIYSFATALPDQIKNLANTAATLAFPKFSARPMEEIMPTLPYRLMLFTLGIAATVGLYLLLAPILFYIFFPAYSASIWYSQLYALALIPVGNIIPLTILQAQAAKRELYILNTVAPAIQLVLLFALIGLYGLVGAIIARIIGRFLNLILSYASLYFVKNTDFSGTSELRQ